MDAACFLPQNMCAEAGAANEVIANLQLGHSACCMQVRRVWRMLILAQFAVEPRIAYMPRKSRLAHLCLVAVCVSHTAKVKSRRKDAVALMR